MNKGTSFFYTKLGITTLIAIGAGLLVLSFYFPYWEMKLRAPQYPQGLTLSVYLDHVEGDVEEVNILNHYIGMGKLDEAAEFERRIAWYALLALALGALIVLPVGKKVYRVFYLPPILFLIGFFADFTYWMYHFGHNLHPDAPVRIKPFTPTMIGTGKIGQFETTAWLGSGFWIAIAATVVIFIAIARKKPICKNCPEYSKCSVICNRPGTWFGRPDEHRHS